MTDEICKCNRTCKHFINREPEWVGSELRDIYGRNYIDEIASNIYEIPSSWMAL